MPDLTVAEIAARLNVTPLTVRLWLRSGALVGSDPDDRVNCRILEGDLHAFLDARRRSEGVQARSPRHTPST